MMFIAYHCWAQLEQRLLHSTVTIMVACIIFHVPMRQKKQNVPAVRDVDVSMCGHGHKLGLADRQET